MTIEKITNGTELTILLGGRLDTTTAPQLEKELKSCLTGVTSLIFDIAGLEYVSSAGLRILLTTQKTMSKQGKMVVRHVNKSIAEVFRITGFAKVLTVE